MTSWSPCPSCGRFSNAFDLRNGCSRCRQERSHKLQAKIADTLMAVLVAASLALVAHLVTL